MDIVAIARDSADEIKTVECPECENTETCYLMKQLVTGKEFSVCLNCGSMLHDSGGGEYYEWLDTIEDIARWMKKCFWTTYSFRKTFGVEPTAIYRRWFIIVDNRLYLD